MKGGNQRSDNGNQSELIKEELISLIKKRRATILKVGGSLVIQDVENNASKMENHLNNIVQKHLLNMVNEIDESIKKIETL